MEGDHAFIIHHTSELPFETGTLVWGTVNNARAKHIGGSEQWPASNGRSQWDDLISSGNVTAAQTRFAGRCGHHGRGLPRPVG